MWTLATDPWAGKVDGVVSAVDLLAGELTAVRLLVITLLVLQCVFWGERVWCVLMSKRGPRSRIFGE